MVPAGHATEEMIENLAQELSAGGLLTAAIPTTKMMSVALSLWLKREFTMLMSAPAAALGPRARLLHDDWRRNRGCPTPGPDFQNPAPGIGRYPTPGRQGVQSHRRGRLSALWSRWCRTALLSRWCTMADACRLMPRASIFSAMPVPRSYQRPTAMTGTWQILRGGLAAAR